MGPGGVQSGAQAPPGLHSHAGDTKLLGRSYQQALRLKGTGGGWWWLGGSGHVRGADCHPLWGPKRRAGVPTPEPQNVTSFVHRVTAGVIR